MNKRFGIIVPVYNTKEYQFVRMIESVVSQSPLFELVVVNDGSNVETKSFLEELSKKYKYKLVNKKNGGLSSARNAGIKALDSEYYIFIDSDDLIDQNMLKEANDYINKFHPDIIYPKIVYVQEHDGKVVSIESKMCKESDLSSILNSREQIQDGYDFVDGKDIYEVKKSLLNIYPRKFSWRILGSVCGAIYSKKILKEVLFDETVKIREDQIFNYSALSIAESVIVTDSKWYFYVQYQQSMLHDYKKEYPFNNTITYWNALYNNVKIDDRQFFTISSYYYINLAFREIRQMAMSNIGIKKSIKYIKVLSGHPLLKMALSRKYKSNRITELEKTLFLHNKKISLYVLAKIANLRESGKK